MKNEGKVETELKSEFRPVFTERTGGALFHLTIKRGQEPPGGHLDDTVSLHTFDVDSKRFTQKAEPNECVKLFNQNIMYAIPPTAKARGHPCKKR